MGFGKEKEIEIFKALAHKSTYKVGLEYGFDKRYPTAGSVRNAVKAIYNKVRANREDYGLSQELVDIVVDSMANRKYAVVGDTTLAEKKEESENKDIKELVTGVRDKTWSLIDKKLDSISKSKKKMNQLSFKDLQVLAGIAFDKTQILKGEATENIAMVAKIDTNMNPEEAIEAALKTREHNVENNISKGK